MLKNFLFRSKNIFFAPRLRKFIDRNFIIAVFNKIIKYSLDTTLIAFIAFIVGNTAHFLNTYSICILISLLVLKLFSDHALSFNESNLQKNIRFSLQRMYLNKYYSLSFDQRQKFNGAVSLEYLVNKSSTTTSYMMSLCEIYANTGFIIILMIGLVGYLYSTIGISISIVDPKILLLLLAIFFGFFLLFSSKFSKSTRRLVVKLLILLGLRPDFENDRILRSLSTLDTNSHLSFEEYLNNLQLLRNSEFRRHRLNDVFDAAEMSHNAKKIQFILVSKTKYFLEAIIFLVPLFFTIPLSYYLTKSLSFAITFIFLRLLLSISLILQGLKILSSSENAFNEFYLYSEMPLQDCTYSSDMDFIDNVYRANSDTDLICESLSYSYDQRIKVISNFSYVFRESNLYAVCGNSGCGKSTLLSMLGSDIVPNSGSIVFPKRKVWFQNQSASAISNSVSNNISYPSYYEPSLDTITSLLNSYLLPSDEWLNKIIQRSYPKNISGGQEKRLLLARLQYNNPDIIILDEPTVGLDSESVRVVISNLLRLSRSGKIVICATHDKSLVASADHVITLS